MKSPGAMVVRSPSTAVYAPEPSTMKRSADCEWRWLGAISPGRISCRPAYRLCVMQEFAAHAGVLEDQHAPDRLPGGDQLARLHQVGPRLPVLPQGG